MKHFILVLLAIGLMACTPDGGSDASANRLAPQEAVRAAPKQADAIRRFTAVARRMAPVAEAACRARAPRAKCGFTITVDGDPEAASNAYQTEDRAGRPVIAFTQKLIAEVRNDHEIAFILGHEAAHHIKGHLPVTTDALITGTIEGELMATIEGKDAKAVRRASAVGGLRAISGFSKEFELEADVLGARIAFDAGYDPLVGAAYFRRMKDPGNKVLSTHPPNAQRLAAVRHAVAGF